MLSAGPVGQCSRFLLALYRAARDAPAGQFEDTALALLKPQVRFDSSVWGSASLSTAGGTISAIHLHEQPPEMIADWQRVAQREAAAFVAATRPVQVVNINIDTDYGEDHRALPEHAARFRKRNALIGRFALPGLSVAFCFSLYRTAADDRFSEDERGLIEILLPHLVEALTMNRLVHLARMYAHHGPGCTASLAVADCEGAVHAADDLLHGVLRAEWPAWEGKVLPQDLIAALTAGAECEFRGRHIAVASRRIGDLLFIKARQHSAFDRLSPREMQVAKFFGAGQSHKEVAHAIGIAPATVRNHLQAIYVKLGVENKAALAVLVANVR